jgi:glycerol-3-phosphate dehydrogenase
LQLQENEPELKEKLHPDYDYTLAEVAWAIRYEMATTVEDVLARRVRLLFLDARAAIACSNKVANLLSKELRHDETWIQNQLTEFKTVANGFLLKEFRVS